MTEQLVFGNELIGLGFPTHWLFSWRNTNYYTGKPLCSGHHMCNAPMLLLKLFPRVSYLEFRASHYVQLSSRPLVAHPSYIPIGWCRVSGANDENRARLRAELHIHVDPARVLAPQRGKEVRKCFFACYVGTYQILFCSSYQILCCGNMQKKDGRLGMILSSIMWFAVWCRCVGVACAAMVQRLIMC